MHADKYEWGTCNVSTCHTGWKRSTNKNKCEVNNCSCPNGVPPSGETCAVDGAKICKICVTGFKLNGNKTACDGMVEK